MAKAGVVTPLLHTANTRLGGTKVHMVKEESPLDHIAKPVCMERSCAKGLSLPLPDLSIVDDFITLNSTGAELVEQENKNS